MDSPDVNNDALECVSYSQHCVACDRRPASKICFRCNFNFCNSHCRVVYAGVLCLWCITDDDYIYDPEWDEVNEHGDSIVTPVSYTHLTLPTKA